MRIPLTAIAVWSLLGSTAPDGRDVVRAAQARYAGKWFTTMTFVQKTTYPTRTANAPGGVIQTWYETMQLPGMLRIDIAPASSGTGMVFRNDSLYQFSGGTLRGARAMAAPGWKARSRSIRGAGSPNWRNIRTSAPTSRWRPSSSTQAARRRPDGSVRVRNGGPQCLLGTEIRLYFVSRRTARRDVQVLCPARTP